MKICATVALAFGVLSPAPRLYSAPAPPVTVQETASAYTLSNGIVVARIHKRSGDLLSLKYKGLELMGGGSGHPFGYWSHSPARAAHVIDTLTIDPAKNGGDRAEVSVSGTFDAAEPGARPAMGTACDIEIRYALGRGDSGLYTCSIFTHRTNYPATGIGEARFGAKLNPAVFDYMTIDARRRKLMPTPEDWDQGTEMNFKEARRLNTGIYKGQVEHKYDYSAIQFDIPAYGWSSTKKHVGLWFINPTIEYLSGGATKVELTGHLDNNEGGLPTLLNYWRGSHYGGSVCVIGEGEPWSKVIGPFLIYCNAAANPDRMWKDALTRAAKENRAWPYEWVQGIDYPRRKERGVVAGQIVVSDPESPGLRMNNLLVGLAAPDYTPPRMNRGFGGPAISAASGGEDESGANAAQSAERSARSERGGNPAAPARSGRGGRGGGGGFFGGPRTVDWQNDAKFYQFWVRGDDAGRFTIPKVRPGIYTLHAITDGVLGEAVKTNVIVRPGESVDFGRLVWRPARFGRQVWQIGIPNRSAEEFRHGDHYWQWGLYYEYTNDFPNDVNFVIGRSDWRKDWNYAQVPRGPREGTTWSVTFDLPEWPRGKATLRLGIAGISLRGGIRITVNGEAAGSTAPLPDTATIRRDGIRGYWSERAVSFDAALMHRGANVLKLSIPGGGAMNGVEYDYLRLELKDALPTENLTRAGR